MKTSKKTSTRKTLIIIITILVIVAAAAGLYISKRNDKNTDFIDTTAKTTSSAASAQENYNSGSDRTPSTTNPNNGTATVTDTNGNQTTTTDKSLWTVSKTGEITVYTPTKDQILSNGATLSGASSLPVIYYRIIDNISGMITQGQLSVVNGKFSGTVNFATKATEGRLDIYGADDSGKEFSNVEVAIRFK
ncbi:MAG: hypothetical protein WCI60_02075 [bacterium]